jgi:electron-transferring-flavoprotein dehydrogenase
MLRGAARALGAAAAASQRPLAALLHQASAAGTTGASRGISASTSRQEALADDERDRMHFDLLIVGAGPAGLAAALRFRQLGAARGRDLSVAVIEKAAEVGGHTLSGAVLQPTALDELLPDWRDDAACPVAAVPATADRFYWLSRRRALSLPTPPQMQNKGNYVVSLSEVVRWLGARAEAAGAEVLPGFAAARLAYAPDGSVRGVVTGDAGVGRDGRPRPGQFAPGALLTAGATLLAEGCRGSLTGEAERRFGLRAAADPQTYALGVKEVWELAPERRRPGEVVHTVGWPLPFSVYGGGWAYHGAAGRLSLGLVTALDFADPSLSPFEEFQQLKRHPLIARLLESGTCLQYGARALVEGGLQALPRLAFPGGALVGDAAGTLVVPKIKGSHTAMKSGALAAEAAFDVLAAMASTEGRGARRGAPPADLAAYEPALRASWAGAELAAARNVRPGFHLFRGLAGGLAHAAVDTYLLRGAAPWTLRQRRADHEALRPAAAFPAPRAYPRPDGVTTFDLPTSLHRSGTAHAHDQPSHLRLLNPKLPEELNWKVYGGPEARYCPAGVYEWVDADAPSAERAGGGGAAAAAPGAAVGPTSRAAKRLQVNAQNCLHCKACDVKDPAQNIRWATPEGGGGPRYTLT